MPNKELCIQISKDLAKYSKYVNGLNILAVYGGSNINTQIKSLNKGAHIVVGTPGRTKDLIKRKLILVYCSNNIDEADEMLTMGLKDDLEMILSHTPKEKQTLLFLQLCQRKSLRLLIHI